MTLLRAVAVMLVVATQQVGVGGGDRRPITDQELQEIYRELPEEDRIVIDGWSETQRREYLITRARVRREERAEPPVERQPDEGVVFPESDFVPYEPDPLLRRAFEAYNDDQRPRDEAIVLFQEYLAKNPQSPFNAEIYFRLGALYSIHKREGEERRIDLQIEYYTKAHELWGDKYSGIHCVAWSTLANRSKSLEFKKSYYDWLLKFQTGERKPSDWYPYRPIEQTFNGRYPLIPEDDLAFMHDFFMKANLAGTLRVAEDNILSAVGNTYQYLADLAQSYPQTRLGQEARYRLHKLDRESTNGAVRLMNDPEFLKPYQPIAESSLDESPWVAPAPEPKSMAVADPSSLRSAVKWAWSGIAGIGVLISGVVVVALLRYRNRTPEKRSA